MRKDYIQVAGRRKSTNKHLVLFFFALLLVWGNFSFALAQCNISIQNINSNCTFSNGQNTFSLSVEVSWVNAPGSQIQVSVGGQTQNISVGSGSSGVQTVNGFQMNQPGMAYMATAKFTNQGACQAQSSVDLIACTPACSGAPNAIGGFVWKDDNWNGLFEGENGQPNVLVEVYDCNNLLKGSVYTNAGGQWSLGGLSIGEDYRVEFSAAQLPEMYMAFTGNDNPSGVQFVTAGDCAVDAAVMSSTSSNDCGNDTGTYPSCGENVNTLNWAYFSSGSNPFPFPPYAVAFDEDVIYWARSSTDGTSNSNLVFHGMYGGATTYYYLEMDADNTDLSDTRDVGVVFAFNRPVADLSFSLLDIDISGDAVDRVAVQGFLGGMPVELAMADIQAGQSVSVLAPNVFQGTASVNDAITWGNVDIRFSQPVDQIAINFSPIASAVSNPGVQGVGIGNISWCLGNVNLYPGCTHIMDWMAFEDGDTQPMPFMMDGVEIKTISNDPFGIGTSSAFQVDNDRTPQGGQRGFWPIYMDPTSSNQYVQSIFTFSQAVDDLSFAVLDIDQDISTSGFQDEVVVRGYLDGVEVALGYSDVSTGYGAQDGNVTLVTPNQYLAQAALVNTTAADGNVYIKFPNPVDSVVVRYEAGPQSPANPIQQFIAISDLMFCICKPAPIQLGNLVWQDENANGTQEACEPALSNLRVSLYNANGVLLATTNTNSEGRYVFTQSGAAGESWLQEGQVMPDTRYYIVFGQDTYNPENQYIQLNGVNYAMTSQYVGTGSHPFMNDSNPDENNPTQDMPGNIPDGLPYIDYTTGAEGQTNHTLDAGFKEAYLDLALRMMLNSDLTPAPFFPGNYVTFTITVFNQGVYPANGITVSNYTPAGLTLEASTVWTSFAGLTTTNIPFLAPGDSTDLDITFRINPNFSGTEITNAAEISRLSNGNLVDIDSNLDYIFSNDAGGAAGSAADNSIHGDGSGGVGSTDAVTDEDDHDVERIIIGANGQFDLALNMWLNGSGPFQPGDPISFSIQVANEGAIHATNIYLQNYIPSGLILNDPNWTANNGIATWNNSIDLLLSGEEFTTSINFLIDGSFGGSTISNMAEISAAMNSYWYDDHDSTPSNGDPEEDDTDVVDVPMSYELDLALDKSVVSAEPFVPGGSVTFAITVSNEGSLVAQNIQIADYVPNGLILNDANWTMTGNQASLVSPIPSLALGASITKQITFTISGNYTGSSITNAAEIKTASNNGSMNDIDSTPYNGSTNEDDDDTAIITIQQPIYTFDLALTKNLNTAVTPGPFEPGSDVSFIITVTNQGNVAATNIQIADYIPSGLVLNDPNWSAFMSTATLALPISSLAPGQSVQKVINFQINNNFGTGIIVNGAEIFGAYNSYGLLDTDSTPANGLNNGEDDQDTESIQVLAPEYTFDLALEKKLKVSATPGPFYPGSTVVFTVTTTNEGNLTATNIQLKDHVPTGLVLNDPNWTLQGNMATRNIGSLAAGASVNTDITFTVASGFQGSGITNLAEVNTATNAQGQADEDSTPGNGILSEDDMDDAPIYITQTFDLALTKTINLSESNPPYSPGEYITYNITVYNQGTLDAQNIQLNDYYQTDGLTLADSDWVLFSGNILRLVNPISYLAAGASITMPITFLIDPVANGTTINNCAEIAWASNTYGQTDIDSTPNNGSHDEDDDDAIDIITDSPLNFDLALIKELNTSVTPGPFYPGSTVTFRITVTNEGQLTAQNIVIKDYIPLGLILNDPSWSAVGSVATRNNTISSLAPGGSTSVNITFQVSPSFAGASIVNYGEIGGATNTQGSADIDSTPNNGNAGPNEDDYDSAYIAVVQQQFDLALTKELNTGLTPGPFSPGSTVTFRINVTNQSSVLAQNIQLREYIPLGLVLNDPNWTAVGSVAELIQPIPSLSAGATTSVNVTFTISPSFLGTTLINFAEIGSAFNSPGLSDIDSTPGNGSAGPNEDDYDDASIAVLQQDFDLALEKELKTSVTPGPFVPGSPVTFKITVTNEGSLTAQNIQIRDYIPLGLLLNDAAWSANGTTATYNNLISSLAPGASTSVDIHFVVANDFSGLSITNYAEIGSASNSLGIGDVDSTPGNGSAGPNEDDYDSAVISIVQQHFDLALTKELNTSLTPGPFSPGSTVTFRITVSNQGGLTAQNIQIRDYIPLGLILNDASWTANGTTATYNNLIASLAPGASTSVNITFAVSPSYAGASIVNYAEIGSATNSIGMGDIDSTPGNGSAGPSEDDYDSAIIYLNQQTFDLALTKTLNTSLTPGPFTPGSTVVFMFTVTNQGNVAASGIQLRDYLPLGLTLNDPNWTVNGSVATYNPSLPTLAAGASANVNITFNISPSFTGSAITNFAEIGAATNGLGLYDVDSTPGNGASGPNEDDYDSEIIYVTPEVDPVFDLALRKKLKTSVTPGPFSPGSTVVFEIDIINQGEMDAYNVQITDYIPNGLLLNDINWTQGLPGLATRTIPGPIAANGGSVTVNISFLIDLGFAGASLVNYAEISAADNDTNPGNVPPNDVDSPYDQSNFNDAGGQPNSAADDALDGNGTGAPGSGTASTDEDDHDPAIIYINNCSGLSAGTNGTVEVCLTCNATSIPVDLFAALNGTPSSGGTWANLDGANVNLSNPNQVDFYGVPAGSYTFQYSVGGQGCATQSAYVEVTLTGITGFACNNQINLSFGPNCEITVIPDMILEGSDACMAGLTVNLINPLGQSIGNIVTVDQIGQLLIAEVFDPYCGFICWGYVNVEDYTPPSITCPVQNVDLVCTDADQIFNNPASLAVTGSPTVNDVCGQGYTITFQDQWVNNGDCADVLIYRTFTVSDPEGNATQCTQVITIRKATADDIIAPADVVELSCTESFETDIYGNPHPSVAGFPLLDTYFGDLPINQSICNIGAAYEDSPPIVVCDGTTKFLRTWTVLNWCSPSNILYFTQLIKVGDTEGPTVTCPNIDYNQDGWLDPIVYSTSPYSCTAGFEVPMPQVTDDCSSWEVLTEIVTDISTPSGIVTSILATIPANAPSRYVSGIPVGCHRFRYKVTDDCNNFTTIECDFCVEDQIEPTAICDDDLHISIGGSGFARIFASDIDEGSNDNCEILSIEVRRRYEFDPQTCAPVTPYYSDWGAFVDFTCCDVGLMVLIELKVTDIYGNMNICWLEVNIEDYLNPDCIAPHDMSISCADLPYDFDPYDLNQLQDLFGVPQAYDDCSTAYWVELTPTVNLDDCGFGTIIRRFQAIDATGNVSLNICQQIVTILEVHDYEIRFPKDLVVDCGGATASDVDFETFGCDQLLVNVTDEIFYTNSPGECYKIFRTFKVLNDCEYNGIDAPIVIGRDEDCDGQPGDEDVWVLRRPNQAYIDRDNSHNNGIPAFGVKSTACDGTTNPAGYWRTSQNVGYWQYTQHIKVTDNIPPQIAFNAPSPFCSFDDVNCDAYVQYPFTVFENCSPDGLIVQVLLDANADGTIDADITSTALSGSYPNFQITGTYPLGNHKFIVNVEDGCGGNTASAMLPFQVVDCGAPTFTCLNGLVFNMQLLPPNTDIDGDGVIDVAAAGIWASDFYFNASDCSDDTLSFSINLVGEAPNINQHSIYFTCQDTGTFAIQVYAWDSAYNPYSIQPDGTIGGPNYSYCDTYVLIQDANNYCGFVQPGPMMAGLISREDNSGVEAVEVALSGQMNMMELTAIDGTYEFPDLDAGYDYTLSPYLNSDHRNGVSTYDLVILQQHLTGVNLLDSPYKRIAADANRTNSITTLDMIEIQKLILGIQLEFPNNTSWRFVASSYTFPVPSNPWFAVFPEVLSVNDLDQDLLAANFVAIKIGDVNNSAATTVSLTGIEDRSFDATLDLLVNDQAFKAGDRVEVSFRSDVLDQIKGYQFTLEFDRRSLELEDVEYVLANENSLGLHGIQEGYITASWYNTGIEMASDEDVELFKLVFRAQSDGTLSQLMHLSSAYTPAEAYNTRQELLNVGLRFGQDAAPQALPFRLYQNRPNPFRDETVVSFDLPAAGEARLSVFDVSGKLLKVYEGQYAKGFHQIVIKRSDLQANGLMYYRLESGENTATMKLLLLD